MDSVYLLDNVLRDLNADTIQKRECVRSFNGLKNTFCLIKWHVFATFFLGRCDSCMTLVIIS